MSDINMSLVKIEGKPIEKLIDTVSSAIGTLYNPKGIRRDAKAEADRMITLASAKARELIIIGDAENELARRASQRFINQEIKKQENIENIADMSVKHLQANVSDVPINEEWKEIFFNKVQNISNTELQKMWAKLLSQEVNLSGSVSIEALELLSTLSPREARLFEKACAFVFEGNYLMSDQSPLYFEKSINY